jgi:hypothetical protein
MRKCTIVRLGIVVRQYSICPTNSHVKNEKLFATRGLDTVDVQLQNGGKVERKKKVHPICGNLASSQTRPSHDRFERLKEFFKFSKVENCPYKHWSDSIGWIMAEAIHNVVLQTTKIVMQKSPFISMSCDEVTTINNQSWLSVHVYVIKEWKKVSIC